jgi:surfactin synthase thioesterase subunit
MSHRVVNLFCFPHAGSSSSVYVRWKRRLPDWIAVRPVELPGRGRRIREVLETTVHGLAERCLAELVDERSRPCALFGHSLGAVVAFEVARRWSELGQKAPLLLVASGSDAPCQRDRERHAALDTEEDLVAELARLGGTPREVLEDRELLALALPVVRADFAASAHYSSESQINCPIYVLGGERDTVSRDGLLAWRRHTHREFELDMLPGGHFFVHEHEADVLHRIAARLARELHDASSEPRAAALAPPLPSEATRPLAAAEVEIGPRVSEC